jgi:hypothetical protein
LVEKWLPAVPAEQVCVLRRSLDMVTRSLVTIASCAHPAADQLSRERLRTVQPLPPRLPLLLPRAPCPQLQDCARVPARATQAAARGCALQVRHRRREPPSAVVHGRSAHARPATWPAAARDAVRHARRPLLAAPRTAEAHLPLGQCVPAPPNAPPPSRLYRVDRARTRHFCWVATVMRGPAAHMLLATAALSSHSAHACAAPMKQHVASCAPHAPYRTVRHAYASAAARRAHRAVGCAAV